jgi:Flp pilus assembly protein CpaB
MNYRVKNIGIAVALAALAAILTSVYVVNYKRHVQHGEGKVTVLVAARDIPVGTSGADVIDKKMLKQQTVPRKVRVPGAISSPDQLSQYVAVQDIYQGEQVSSRRFAAPQEQGIRAKIKGTATSCSPAPCRRATTSTSSERGKSRPEQAVTARS